jgi:hypothetical protein
MTLAVDVAVTLNFGKRLRNSKSSKIKYKEF